MVTPDSKSKLNQGVRKGEEISNRISKRLYSLKESAVYLGRGLHGVRDMVWRGEIPIVRSGRKMFIDIRDLEEYVERNKMVYE
jgi:excisionase family DNA binding protein